MDSEVDGALSDPAFEHEIGAALAAEPSPEFLARVRSRVAAETVTGGGWATWMRAGAIAGAAVILLAFVTWRAPRDTSPRASRPPDVSAAPVVASAEAAVPVEQPTEVVPASRVEPVALISDDEARALDRLFRDVSAGRVEVSLWPDEFSVAEPLMPIRELAIDPIDVSPLAPIGE